MVTMTRCGEMAVGKEVLFGHVSSGGIDEGVTRSWGTKLRHGVGAEFENNLMRSFPKAPTCCLNFDLNFPEFPNSEVGNLKLRLLVTGVEAQVEAQVGVELEMFETP